MLLSSDDTLLGLITNVESSSTHQLAIWSSGLCFRVGLMAVRDFPGLTRRSRVRPLMVSDLPVGGLHICGHWITAWQAYIHCMLVNRDNGKGWLVRMNPLALRLYIELRKGGGIALLVTLRKHCRKRLTSVIQTPEINEVRYSSPD